MNIMVISGIEIWIATIKNTTYLWTTFYKSSAVVSFVKQTKFNKNMLFVKKWYSK